MPIKLDHRHRAIAEKLFCHPICHNIRWIDARALLERFGDVHETHRGNWAVTVNGETYSFGPAKSKELSDEQVIKVRHFLRQFGVTPERLRAA